MPVYDSYSPIVVIKNNQSLLRKSPKHASAALSHLISLRPPMDRPLDYLELAEDYVYTIIKAYTHSNNDSQTSLDSKNVLHIYFTSPVKLLRERIKAFPAAVKKKSKHTKFETEISNPDDTANTNLADSEFHYTFSLNETTFHTMQSFFKELREELLKEEKLSMLALERMSNGMVSRSKLWSEYQLASLASLEVPHDVKYAKDDTIYFMENSRDLYVRGMYGIEKIPENINLTELGKHPNDPRLKKILLPLLAKKNYVITDSKDRIDWGSSEALYNTLEDCFTTYATENVVYYVIAPQDKITNNSWTHFFQRVSQKSIVDTTGIERLMRRKNPEKSPIQFLIHPQGEENIHRITPYFEKIPHVTLLENLEAQIEAIHTHQGIGFYQNAYLYLKLVIKSPFPGYQYLNRLHHPMPLSKFMYDKLHEVTDPKLSAEKYDAYFRQFPSYDLLVPYAEQLKTEKKPSSHILPESLKKTLSNRSTLFNGSSQVYNVSVLFLWAWLTHWLSWFVQQMDKKNLFPNSQKANIIHRCDRQNAFVNEKRAAFTTDDTIEEDAETTQYIQQSMH
ncbi:MAG: hypothetical protein ACO1N3_00650 [Gammaproteobacteria bacterium]